jgi:hypothetical protein
MQDPVSFIAVKKEEVGMSRLQEVATPGRRAKPMWLPARTQREACREGEYLHAQH